MEELEISAKTVEEAIQRALEQLGVDNDQVEVVVLKKGKSGVLGVGAEEAKVKVRLLAQRRQRVDIIKVVTEVLETLLKFMGITAEVKAVEAAQSELPVTLDIEGDDLGILIGRRGQALASLQYIVKLIVAEQLKTWVPVTIDVAGYKKRRHEALQGLALRLAEQVKTSQRPLTLEPMPSGERRIIHLTLANHPDVTTQSVGEGEARKVVILLKKH